VAALLEEPGQLAPDPAASHDDDVHLGPFRFRRSKEVLPAPAMLATAVAAEGFARTGHTEFTAPDGACGAHRG
jgi:hypothetical protein